MTFMEHCSILSCHKQHRSDWSVFRAELKCDNNTQMWWLKLSLETTKTAMKVNFWEFLLLQKKKTLKKFTLLLQKHLNTWWCDFILKKYHKNVSIYFSISKAWNIGEEINNADASLCKGILSIWGVIEKPQCPGFKALLHGTMSGIFISDGYLGADTETDRISEPRMIQGSPLKINRQTGLHWSRLFISASLHVRPFISAGFCRKSTHIKRVLIPQRQTERERERGI